MAQAMLYPLLAGALALVGVRIAAEGVLLAAALLGAHWAALHWADPRGWDVVALGRAALRPRALATGFAAGAAAISLPTLALLAGGWLRVDPAPDGPWWSSACSLALYLLPAALWEELLFRGYAFRAVADWAGEWSALIVSSVLFGLVHLGNAGATARSTALVTLAGVFLGALLLRTRSLYAAWAAHWAWNWTMAALFHVAVSGSGFATPDYRTVDAGPDWLTGGVWGPEGGAAAGAGMIGALLLLLGSGRTRRAAGHSATQAAAADPRTARRGGD